MVLPPKRSRRERQGTDPDGTGWKGRRRKETDPIEPEEKRNAPRSIVSTMRRRGRSGCSILPVGREESSTRYGPFPSFRDPGYHRDATDRGERWAPGSILVGRCPSSHLLLNHLWHSCRSSTSIGRGRTPRRSTARLNFVAVSSTEFAHVRLFERGT